MEICQISKFIMNFAKFHAVNEKSDINVYSFVDCNFERINFKL